MAPKTAAVVYWNGDCAARFSPASTFKIPLAVMGFDSGILASRVEPVLEYREGDIDWGGAAWKQATDPERWMRFSVVWYSQRIVAELGRDRLQRYVSDFRFGNEDLSGNVNRGETPAWVESTLQISPLEQVQFITRVMNRELPVSARSIKQASALLEARTVDGWTLRGKTGSTGPLRSAPPEENRAKGLGWFVGWAESGERAFAFAHLIRDEEPTSSPAGIRARSELLQAWPRLLKVLGEE